MTDIDELLKAPLEPIKDDGFSRAVTARIENESRESAWLEAGTAVAVLALIALFAPLKSYLGPIDGLAVSLANSVPLAIACGCSPNSPNCRPGRTC
jgi:hypothetical protein